MPQVDLKPLLGRIRNVITNYGEGKVLIPGSLRGSKPESNRTAPSYLLGTNHRPSKEYCAARLAQYLDMTDSAGRKTGREYRRANRNVETSLLLLQCEELGIISPMILEMMVSGEEPFSVNLLQEHIKEVLRTREAVTQLS